MAALHSLESAVCAVVTVRFLLPFSYHTTHEQKANISFP